MGVATSLALAVWLVRAGLPAGWAPPFRAPAWVGNPFVGLMAGSSLMFARGAVAWVAAEDGLRRYDFDEGVLSRPLGLPEGPATAVAGDAQRVIAAVGDRLFEAHGDGRAFREIGPPSCAPSARGPLCGKSVRYLAIDGEVTWVVTDAGLYRRALEGDFERVGRNSNSATADISGRVQLVAAARGVTWFTAASNAGTGETLLRVRAGRLERFAHPQPGKFLAVERLAVDADGAALLALAATRGDAVHGAVLLRFDGNAWAPIADWRALPSPVATGVLRAAPRDRAPLPASPAVEGWGTAARRLWIRDNDKVVEGVVAPAHLPDGPWPAREAGHALALADTSAGLLVLGDRRLARWHEGRWRYFSSPSADGTSVERWPTDAIAFAAATAYVLKPPSAGGAVRRRPVIVPDPDPARWAPAWRGSETDHAPRMLGGVPLHVVDMVWPGGAGVTGDLQDVLPDLAPADRLSFVGLREGAALRAVNGEASEMILTGDLPAGAGAVVAVEAAPVIVTGAEGAPALRFRLNRVHTLVRSVRPAVEAARAFHARHLRELGLALGNPPCVPSTDVRPSEVAYDAGRSRLSIHLSCTKRLCLTSVTYLFGEKLDAVFAGTVFLGE